MENKPVTLNRSKNELLALTGIRGLAATGVLLGHINADLLKWVDIEKFFFAQPYVDLFFVLSGFVISYVYLPTYSWTRSFFYKFYSARFARIYPLYLFALIVYLLSYSSRDILKGTFSFDFIAIGNQLVLLSAMPFFYLKKLLVFTSWSVSIEWWLYVLLFPVLLMLKNAQKLLSSPVVITLLSVAVVVYMYSLSGEGTVTRSWPAWIRGVTGFTSGWLLYYHFKNTTAFAKFCAKYCNVFAALWFTLMIIVPLFTNVQPWTVLIVSPFLILGLCYKSASSNFLSNKVMVFLGDVSYSVYLLHPVVLVFLKSVVNHKLLKHPMLASVLYPIAAIVIVMAISTLTYKFLEKPARKYILSRLVPQHKTIT